MRVTIANPRGGGAKKLSARRAQNLVRRCLATWTPDGRLQIHEEAKERHAKREREGHSGNSRRGSDVYVQGDFEIAVVDRWSCPHTQWLHGETAE
jgi:hypothetical protein